MRRSARWNMFAALVVACSIALGAQGVWGFICIWTQSVFGESFGAQLNEALEITRDGRALVRHIERVDGVWRYTYRTLDGQDVSDATVRAATGVHVLAAPLKPQSLDWPQRAIGFADTQSWPAYWFLIRDAELPGNAYFTIYDGQSRQLLGYFGPHGFRPDLPPANEQFVDVPPGGYALIDTTAPYSGGSLWNRATAAYIVGNGGLWLIDVEKRTIRPIPISGEPVAVAWTGENDYNGDDFHAADFDSSRHRLLVRMRDEIALLSVQGELRHSLSVPAEVRKREFNFYESKAGDVILTANRSVGHDDVYWIGDAAGQQRHEEVRLAGMQSADDNPLTAWYTVAILPNPFFLNAGYVMEGAEQVASGVASSMAESLAKSFNRDWPAMLAVWTVSAILAALCYRHHRRYTDRGGAAWALFVLVMGVPGAVGYWLHRQWPATERCDHCGAVVPRDRDGCLACAAEFPAPALKGIEVLA